jgi:HAD superfamily hydrolase (TIGR01484 family)
MYKHIFCDLDNTLFGKDLIVSDVVVDTINRLHGKVGFSICTARGASEAFPLLEKVILTAPQIVENGATVMLSNGEILQRTFLAESDAQSLIQYLVTCNVWKKACINGEMVDLDSVTNFSHITKIALQDLTEALYKEIEKEISAYSTISFTKSHAAHKEGFLTMDISSMRATKQEAIVYVMEKLGLRREEVIGIGDSYNDYSLLMACGLRVAVGNAIPEIKAIADYIGPRVTENGVAEIIKKYCPS